MESLTLQQGGSIIGSGDTVGQIQFAAPSESDAGASRYIIGQVYAYAEGAFNASSNPASLIFATSATDNLPASGKIKISHEGHILPLEDNVYDLGSSSERFRHLYVADTVVSPTGELSYLYFDTTVGDVDQVAGQLNWNSEAGSLDLGLTSDLTIHLGQSVLFRVKNSTGSTITKGEAVYASGVLGGGQIIQVAPFVADESIDEVRFIGLMTDDLANGEDGFVNHFGHIKNVDLRTSNTVLNPNAETWNIGDILFVDDSSAGGLTKVQPKDDIYVAFVLADGQNGELFVRITDPGHINQLHDVDTSDVADNNFLVWNSGTDVFEPSSGLYYVDDKLGVGVESPTRTLDVQGSMSIHSTSIPTMEIGFPGAGGQAYVGYTASNQTLNFSAFDGSHWDNIRYKAGSSFAGNHYFYTSSTTSPDVAILKSGRVGISTIGPDQRLHVNDGNIKIENSINPTIEFDDASYVRSKAYYDTSSETFILQHTDADANQLVLTSGNDVGIGTNAPNATLHVYSATSGDNVFNVEGTNGSLFGVTDNLSGVLMSVNTIAGLPVLEVNSDYSVTAGRFNQNDFVISSSGNVGMGTSTPTTKLDVSGVITATGGNSDEWNESYDWINASGVDGSGAANHIAYWSDSNSITYDSGNLYWDSSNDRLGIGTDSPEQKLHIDNGNVRVENTNPVIEFHDTSDVGADISFVNDGLVLSHADVTGDNQLVIASNSGVGVGTDAPTATLHAYSPVPSSTVFNVEGTNGSLFSVVDNLSGVLMSVNNNAGLPVFEVYDDDSIVAGRFAQNDFIVTTSGDVGIGTANPVSKLEVNGTITATGGDSDEWNEAYDWVSASGGLPFASGTGSTGHVPFWTDTNQLSYSTNQLRWDSSNNRLTIGNGNAIYPLTVHGDAGISSTINAGQFAFYGDNLNRITKTTSLITHSTSTEDRDFSFGSFTGATYTTSFYINNGTRSSRVYNNLFVDGNIGVKNLSPVYDLDVDGSGNFTGDILVGGDANITGDVIVGGNVTVNGTTVSANVDTMEVADPILTLGLSSGNIVTNTNLDRGMALALNDGVMGFMGWDTSADSFTLLSSGIASNGSGNYAPGTYGDLLLGEASFYGANTRLDIDELDTTTMRIKPVGNLMISAGSSANIRFAINSSEQARLSSNGNFGIGDSSPSSKLHVVGPVLNNSFQDYGIAAFENTDLEGLSIGYDADGGYTYLLSREVGVSTRGLYLNGSIYVNGYGGNVGIKTGNPLYNLDVVGTGNFSGDVYANGNVGIGTSSPSEKLHVAGDVLISGVGTTIGGTTWDNGWLKVGSSSDGISIDGNEIYATNILSLGTLDSSSPILFKHGTTERMRVDSGGNVGIGTNAPTAKLHVLGTAKLTSTIEAPNIGADTDNSVVILNSAGLLKTDEIDSRVWGSSLVDGSGTANYAARWTDSNTLGTGIIYDNGTGVGIATTAPSGTLHVVGEAYVDNLKLDGNTLSATNTDGNLILSPNGNGALQADGGGNARGAGAVDLQRFRADVTQVAIGACSVISGGSTNKAISSYGAIGGGYGNVTCSYAVVSGGRSNQAQGTYATVSGGYANCANSANSTVGGGVNNQATNSSVVGGGQSNCAIGALSAVGGGTSNKSCGACSTVSGGYDNTASGGCSIISGGRGNCTSNAYSSIGGGYVNCATNYGSVVAGGQANRATGGRAAILGGGQNCACADYSSVAGGCLNVIQPSGTCGFIGGGCSNLICGDNSCYGVIGGGFDNLVAHCYSTVGGGHTNCATGPISVVAGGQSNGSTGYYSVISGGTNNCSVSSWSTVSGGRLNCATNGYSFVGGGRQNTASNTYASVVGGCNNNVYCCYGFIGGGTLNVASGDYSAVVAGSGNIASGACSFIGGGFNNSATNNRSVVSGGSNNIASAIASTISGGLSNSAVGTGSVVAGGSSNCANNSYSTVGGGYLNCAAGVCSTVSGGQNNLATGDWGVVGGGWSNNNCGGCSVIAGGRSNRIVASLSFIGAGYNNLSSGGSYNVIGGGLSNSAPSSYNFIGGGRSNSINGVNNNRNYNSISGGYLNCVDIGTYNSIHGGYCNCIGGYSSSIIGGALNTIQNSIVYGIAGGRENNVYCDYGIALGGTLNVASGDYSAVVAGSGNIASGAYSFIGGGYDNTASGACSTVGGGHTNCATGLYSFVGGGNNNTASNYYSVVSGGVSNQAVCPTSSIGGGFSNIACGPRSTIAGGSNNLTTGACSTVSGGQCNCARETWSTVSGGTKNDASGNSSTISGGYDNYVSGSMSTISGGRLNCATGNCSTIGGGFDNCSYGLGSTVGGGRSNAACNNRSTVSGGYSNTASGYYSTIGGGYGNNASGYASTVSGGLINCTSGDYSSIAGGNNNNDGGYANVHILGSGITATQADTTYTQNIIADGHLAATTKSFLINHPTRPGHKLQYGSLESPYHGVRLTGRDKIASGWCVVKLPEYIRELVNDNEEINIQLTNYQHSKVLYVDSVDIKNNEFTVKTKSWFSDNAMFFWSFTATRKDIDPLRVEY